MKKCKRKCATGLGAPQDLNGIVGRRFTVTVEPSSHYGVTFQSNVYWTYNWIGLVPGMKDRWVLHVPLPPHGAVAFTTQERLSPRNTYLYWVDEGRLNPLPNGFWLSKEALEKALVELDFAMDPSGRSSLGVAGLGAALGSEDDQKLALHYKALEFGEWLEAQGFTPNVPGENYTFPPPEVEEWDAPTTVIVRINTRDHDFRVLLRSWEHPLADPDDIFDATVHSVAEAKKLVGQALVQFDELQQGRLEGLGGRAVLPDGTFIVKYLMENGFERHPISPNWYWRHAEHSLLDVIERDPIWIVRLVSRGRGSRPPQENWITRSDDASLVSVIQAGLVRQDAFEEAKGSS